VPIPSWFWVWARWYLGRGEFDQAGPKDDDVRPATAPRVIPTWAWWRLTALLGKRLPPVPATPLRPGDRGKAVDTLQRALNGVRFVAGPVDGIYGSKTRYGVIAFEKAHGLEPDGVVDSGEYLRIIKARRPSPPITGRTNYVYIDLDRQILLDVRQGRVTRVLPVSTGGGFLYTGLDGEEHVATTPRGRFHVYRRVAGTDTSYLGNLYYPAYFTGGYAVHGSRTVPARPVSHGCVRIPYYLARTLFQRMQLGTLVIVA
jgi:peptidoglycan hydrolase-like protein with peptidoglycan-binding domain